MTDKHVGIIIEEDGLVNYIRVESINAYVQEYFLLKFKKWLKSTDFNGIIVDGEKE